MLPNIGTTGPEAQKRKAGLNKKDFILVNFKNTELIKKPGQINGQAFQINQLENCRVFLLDYLALIYVDNCKNCQIFIGPIKGSIFCRNCTNCKISACCEQFRCRECEKYFEYENIGK